MQDPFTSPVYKKNSLTPEITDFYDIIDIVDVSAKFLNIYVKSKDRGYKYTIQWIPQGKSKDTKTPKFNNLTFSKFLTEKFVKNNRSPHIASYLDSKIGCPGSVQALSKILGIGCPDIRSIINKNAVRDHRAGICEIMARQLAYDRDCADLIITRGWGRTMRSLLKKITRGIDERAFRKEDYVFRKIEGLNRIIFQTIFTLAVIRSAYPGFSHGYLVPPNVLVEKVDSYNENEYSAYYINDKIFYVKCNGLHGKIRNFGFSYIPGDEHDKNGMGYNSLRTAEETKEYPIGPDDNSFDMWNLLVPIWAGIRLGEHNLDGNIAAYLSRFFNMKLDEYILDFMSDPYNYENLQDGIDGIHLLDKFVMPPEQYLGTSVFDEYLMLPEDAKIVHHFNRNIL